MVKTDTRFTNKINRIDALLLKVVRKQATDYDMEEISYLSRYDLLNYALSLRDRVERATAQMEKVVKE